MHADETPAAELWRRTLSQIPTVFGRLVYLAALRDANTGLYQHFGFAQRFSDREADKALRRSHANTFESWLHFSLEQQKDDLETYLDGLDQDRAIVLANWKAFPPFTGFLPASSKDVQRQLFLSDLDLVIDIVK